jgi:hypothetical protein
MENKTTTIGLHESLENGVGDSFSELSKFYKAKISSPSSTPTSAIPTAVANNWGKISSAGLSPSMYGRILRLASAGDQTATRLSAASLGNFLGFWKLIRSASAEPELALASDGSLCAEWYKSRQQRLDIRFTPDQAVFGLLSRNAVLEGAQRPNSALANTLRHHPSKPLQWVAA